MNPVEPTPHEGGRIITFAKNQPPYRPLPASIDMKGTVVTEWEFTADELEKVLHGGRIRLWILYTKVVEGEPMNPLNIEVLDPECGFEVGHGPKQG